MKKIKIYLESSEIVFVGYGLSRDNYDDYNGLNVTGKIVLLSSDLPEVIIDKP